MDAKELVRKLSLDPVICANVPLQMQFGMPMLDMVGDRLIIHFRLHREDYENQCIVFYPCQYEVAWEYPFKKLVLFKDLSLERPTDALVPLHTIPAKRMLSIGRFLLEELFDECTRLISVRAEKGTISQMLLQNYHKHFDEVVGRLELNELYH